MDYNNAIKYIEDHWNLVGTTTEKGLKIGKLIIVPSNEKVEKDSFLLI